MRKKWFVTLALVLSLALVGLGLAQWTDSLTIGGSVATGNIDPVFTDAFTNDDTIVDDENLDPDDDGTDPGYTINVASKTAAINAEDPTTLTCTIENGYPCYTATTFFEITNNGSVPVIIDGVAVTGDTDEVDVTVTDLEEESLVGQQINPGESLWGMAVQHVTDSAEQSSDYTYSVTISAIQWNAYSPPEV